MKNIPLISVIVPIYNIPHVILEQCIASIINQTLKNIEIILIDDGSTNNCISICNKFVEKDSRIKLIHQNNHGVSFTRNKGIEIATANHIVFIDADDWINSKMLEIVYGFVHDFNPDVILWDYKAEKKYKNDYYINNNNINFIVYDKKEDIDLLQRAMIGGIISEKKNGMHGGPVCKLYRKNILLKYNICFNNNLIRSQDNEMNFRYFEHVKRAIYIDIVLYHYRQHEDSVTHRYSENSKQIQELYLKELKNDLIKYNKPEIFFEDYNYILIEKLSDIIKTQYAHPNNPTQLKYKINSIKNIINSEPYFLALKKVEGYKFNKILKIIIPLAKSNKYYLIYLLYRVRYIIKRGIILKKEIKY